MNAFPRSQRRRGLPAGDLHRIVPCTDAGAHPKRHPLAVGNGVAKAVHVSRLSLCQRGKIGQRIRPAWHIGAHRLAKTFADIHHLEAGQLIILCAHQAGGTLQDFTALSSLKRGPAALCLAGDGNRLIEHFAGGRLDPCDHLAGCGIEFVDRRLAACRLPPPI